MAGANPAQAKEGVIGEHSQSKSEFAKQPQQRQQMAKSGARKLTPAQKARKDKRNLRKSEIFDERQTNFERKKAQAILDGRDPDDEVLSDAKGSELESGIDDDAELSDEDDMEEEEEPPSSELSALGIAFGFSKPAIPKTTPGFHEGITK